MERISIIIPAYNEEKRIKETLEQNLKFFKNLKKNKILDFEIIVVVNGSRDKTIEIVKDFAKKNKELKYLNLKRGAKGYAVIEGFKEALKSDSNLIGFKDADMATKPEAFYELIKKIGDADGIIASRYIRGSIIAPKPTLERIFASRIYNTLIRLLFFLTYKDTQCGAKIFKKRAIESVVNSMGMTKWAFDLELIYLLRKKGFKIREISTRWSDTEYSKINFARSGPWMALAVIRLRILHSPFKRFIKIYDKLIKFIPK